jgi:RNA polymerase sigma-70 factor (ECF subfamily)
MIEADFDRLLASVREGSEAAAWELFDKFNQPILRVVRRRLPDELRGKFDSVDFVQATWASIYAHRSRMANFDGPRQFVAYVGAIAAHKIGMEIRRRLKGKKYAVRAERSLDAGERAGHELCAASASPSEIAIARERWSDLLRNRSPEHQEMIRMRLAGHTFQQIADTLGFDERTVRRVMQRVSQECRE